MGKINLQRGDEAIAFENTFDTRPALPPASENVLQIVQNLINKARDLEVLIEGKVNIGEIKSEIAIGSELIKIQATEVVVVGGFTVVDFVNDQNGTTSNVPVRLTRIVGDLVQTGAIVSNNFGAGQGTQIDLDNSTIIMGGSASPKFDFDGTDLFIEGSIVVGSLFAGDINTSGSIFSDGSTVDGGFFGCFVANPTSGAVNGFRSTTTSNSASADFLNSGGGSAIVATKSVGSTGLTAAITGISAVSGNPVLALINTGGGNAISMASPKISGDVNFLDDVDIDLTLVVGGKATFNGDMDLGNSSGDDIDIKGNALFTAQVDFNADVDFNSTTAFTGIATFNSNVVIQGNSDLSVDRSCNFAADGFSGDSSVTIGGASVTGQNTLVIKQGTAGSTAAGQVHFYAKDDASLGTMFGMNAEQAAQNTTGGFSVTKGIPVTFNGALLFIGCSTVL